MGFCSFLYCRFFGIFCDVGLTEPCRCRRVVRFVKQGAGRDGTGMKHDTLEDVMAKETPMTSQFSINTASTVYDGHVHK